MTELLELSRHESKDSYGKWRKMFRTVETMTGKQVYTDDEFINIGFKNNHHYDESVINAPITYQGNAVGVITDIDNTYVFGILRTDILPEISVDTHKVVSFELHSSQKDNESSDVEIRCSNVGMKAGSWQCNFCLMKNKCGALSQVKKKSK